jgi:hypothetical protein
MMISQAYFDEMCLENFELFFDEDDNDDDNHDDCGAAAAARQQAVEATLEQLAMTAAAAAANGSSSSNSSSNSSSTTNHLLTSFPTSPHGIRQRARVAEFLKALLEIQIVLDDDDDHDHSTMENDQSENEDKNEAFAASGDDADADADSKALQKHLEFVDQRLFSSTRSSEEKNNTSDANVDSAAAGADVVDRTVYMALFVSSMHDGFALYLKLWNCLYHNNNNNNKSSDSSSSITRMQQDDLYRALWSTLVRVLLDNDNDQNSKKPSSSRRQVLSLYQTSFAGITASSAAIISMWLQTVHQKLRALHQLQQQQHYDDQGMLLLPILVVQDLQHLFALAYYGVKQCEANKKAIMSVNVIPTTNSAADAPRVNLVQVVLASLDWILAKVQQNDAKEEHRLCMLLWTRDIGRLITALDTFDDFSNNSNNNSSSSSSAGVVSSGHDHVQAWKNARAIDKLHALLVVILQRQQQQQRRQEKREVIDCGDGQDDEKRTTATTTTATRTAADAAAAAIVLALRSMAIQDDVVQAMVSLGILDTATQILLLSISSSSNKTSSSLELLSAVMGLVRNLCANDEIKTNLCLGSTSSSGTSASTNKSSIVPGIIHAMQRYNLQQLKKGNATTATNTTLAAAATLQEHAIGTMAAMALRKPFNSDFIVRKCHAHVDILQAMRDFPQKTTLQRQGALCIRNLASRAWTMSASSNQGGDGDNNDGNHDEDDDQDLRAILLQADAATVLRATAAKHLHCQDEVYAALRDLGVPNVHFTVVHLDPAVAAASTNSITTFGQGHNRNFRPVQDESK